MRVRGDYFDIVRRKGCAFEAGRWKSNRISTDLGAFIASLLKKRFAAPMGIEYMAIGNGGDEAAFKNRISSFFSAGNMSVPFFSGDSWAWAKGIEPESIVYLDSADNEVVDVTNRLKIETVFERNQPAADMLELREFALLGRDAATGQIFLVNYVKHQLISKDRDMELTRTIRLYFPVGEGA